MNEVKVTLTQKQIIDLKAFIDRVNSDDSIFEGTFATLITRALPAITEVVEAFVPTPSKICKKIFVYGTLKVGGYFAKHFDDDRKSTKVATVRSGQLWGSPRFSGFPMMIKTETEEDPILGELHEYDENKFDEIIEQMDGIEGFREYNLKSSLFTRELVTCTLLDGSEEKAWAYFFNRTPPGSAVHIKNGVWKIEKEEFEIV